MNPFKIKIPIIFIMNPPGFKAPKMKNVGCFIHTRPFVYKMKVHVLILLGSTSDNLVVGIFVITSKFQNIKSVYTMYGYPYSIYCTCLCHSILLTIKSCLASGFLAILLVFLMFPGYFDIILEMLQGS